MKKTINILLIFSLLTACFASCQKEEKELDKGETLLELKASELTVELDQRMDANQVLSLTWTSGTNNGTGAAIEYVLEMDVKGNDFRDGMKLELGKIDSRLLNFTHKALNDTIIKYFPHLPVEVAAEFETRVRANVLAEGVEEQTSNIVTLQITTYKKRFINLYMVGDATPGGWDNQRALAMGFDPGIKGEFVWSGTLNQGELKFITELGSFLPSFNKGADENSLVFRQSDSDPDDKFYVSGGQYTIRLNIEQLIISITGGDPVLWIIGDATPNGWDADNGIKMSATPGTEGGFNWQGRLNAGTLKFIVNRGMFLPSYNKGADDNTLVYRTEDSQPDDQFSIATAGIYKITLNTTSLTISIEHQGEAPEYQNIWLIGDATPGGWSWDNVTPFTVSGTDMYEFVYDGYLNTGEFKCPVEINHNWNGKFIMPLINHPSLSDTGYQAVNGDVADNKWEITEAGNYRVVINQRDKTIHITKK